MAKKSVINPSDVVTDKMESVNEIISLKLEDMDGIGSVRLKKLYSNGIYTVDDLLGYGEESLSRMLDISWDDARKMTMVANESLNSEDVLSSIVISGRDYYNFRKDKIKYSTTGVEELDEIEDKRYATAFFITRADFTTCGKNILPEPNKSPTTFIPVIKLISITSIGLVAACLASSTSASIKASTPFTSEWVILS